MLKKLSFAVLLSVFISGIMAQTAEPTGKLSTMEDSLSYSFGILIGNNLKMQKVEGIHQDVLCRGLQDGFSQTSMSMNMDEANLFIQNFFNQMNAAASSDNLAKGRSFLEENRKLDGVITLPSGLQYKVITRGTGKIPQMEDQVKVHYTGRLIDGTVFDSSIERGEPIKFPCNGVIKGWTEALLLMSEGSRWMLYIPSELAYGENGAGGVIGPNEALIFEVELLQVISE